MASRLTVYNAMIETGLVPVFYMNEPEAAEIFMRQCMDGGVQVFEFTNRGPQALGVFQHLRTKFPDAILGIGSVVDAPTAALFVAYGADFIVGPNFDADIMRFCHARKIAYVPGCGSVSEIHHAELAGAEMVKLFPASLYGPDFVKAVLAPCPWTRIMPTGGVDVTEASIQAWFEAGVSCVGIGSQLRQVDDVAATCQQVLGWIKQHRQALL